MHVTVSPIHVVSRVLAVLLIAAPLAYISCAMDEAEQQMIAKLNHQELLQYLRDGRAQSWAGQYLQVAIMVLLLVVLVEGVAVLLRQAVRMFQISDQHPRFSEVPPYERVS
jgi:hypothetical protein